MTQEIQLEIDRLKKQLQNQNIPASLKEKISLKIRGLEDTVEKTEEQVQVIEKKEEKLEQKAEGDLSEAIERMEKQLKNPQIPNSLKDKIREKIEKAKADIKEVKKEQVEEKKIKEEKVAQAKQEVKETLKKVKEVIKKTSTPKEKTEEVKKAVAKSSEAVQKAKKATEESTKSTKKRTSRLTGALRELQQIINANPTLKALYKGKGVDLKRDAARQAKPIGYRFKGKHNYRIPKNLDNPNVYYEGRPDKGDAYQNKRRGVYFADGGMMAKGGKFLESRYSKFPNSRINFDKTYYVLVNEKSGYVPLKSHNKDFVLEKYKEFKKSYSKEDNTYNVYEVNDFEFTLIGGDDFANGGMMARGGKTKGRYNEGLSWHQDHARFNKSEKYEKPLKRRRKY
jgi:chemotaxis protein histidine kinase CheA